MKVSIKTYLLLFALICLATSQHSDSEPEHECNHHQHQIENPPDFLDVDENFEELEDTEENHRMLASKTNPQIRIYANYDNLARTAGSSYTSYVRDLLAPAVIKYFEAAMKVKYPVAGNLKLSSSVGSLCGMSTPSALKNGVAADYAILFDSRSESSSVVATSRYCYLATGSKRPLIGTTNFNRQMFKEYKGDVILHEKNTYLLLHEMMHTFGFSTSMYKYFVSATGKTLSGHVKSVKIGGYTHTVVNVPALTDRLRKYHGCSTVPGAIMEDDNGSGSHFEKKFYTYETMASGSLSGKRISELSLALLEASGWYEIDYSYAEPYFQGQGQGCNFINGKCSSSSAAFEEFCTGSNRGCSFMGHSGGKCYNDDKTNGCKYINPSNSYHCEIASAANNARLKSVESYGREAGSRCFSGSLNTKSSTSATSFCFKYNCVGSGSNAQVEVVLGSKKAICKNEGRISVSGYYGTLDCPDPVSFCSTAGKKYCPRNCMGRGNCVNNKCQCHQGFKGIDCALKA